MKSNIVFTYIYDYFQTCRKVQTLGDNLALQIFLKYGTQIIMRSSRFSHLTRFLFQHWKSFFYAAVHKLPKFGQNSGEDTRGIATPERILKHCDQQQAESRSSHIRHEDHHIEILWAWLV